MATKDYAKRHEELGLCRNCPKSVERESKYCLYHLNKNRDRRRKNDKRAAIDLKKICIEHYGGKCKCCNEKIIQFLTIDHKNGKGNKHRVNLFGYNVGGVKMYRWLIKNNFPSDYEVLCMNCNWG